MIKPLLFFYFLSCVVWSQNTSCDPEFVFWKNKQYAFIRGQKPSFNKAKCLCEDMGMTLLNIKSESENVFIQNKAFEIEGVKAKDGNQFWLGASDSKNEGKWKWVNNSVFFYDEAIHKVIDNNYNNWGKTSKGRQPNNFYKNNEDEDCMVIRPDGFWYDIGCKTRLAYVICERQIK